MTREQLFQALGEAAAADIPGLSSSVRPIRRGRWGMLAACAALAVTAAALWSPHVAGPIPATELPPAAPPGILEAEDVPGSLPALRYGQIEMEADLSLAPPEGGLRRSLTQADITALIGDEETLDSLDWTGYTLEGSVIFRPDGTIWMLLLYGTRGPLDHFELTLSPDELPPTCVLYGGSAVNQVEGVEVYAERYDSGLGLSRRISFLSEGVGYRFALTGESGTAGITEERASRFLQYALREGLDLSAVSSEGSTPIEPPPSCEVGEPRRIN